MTSDLDICRSAKLLIDQHGENAEIQAAIQVDANRHEGDIDGQRVWLRVIEAIKVLRRTNRRGDVVH